jgi:abequosyltransferase
MENSTPILSICIPTNNRADFLKDNLEAVAKLIDPATDEIVVADDCSSDNTSEVIINFQKAHPNIQFKYRKYKKRIYFDRMVLNIVKIASGRYCWLLGDDDLPARTSVKKIKSVTNKHPDVTLIHLNYSRFDSILKKITAKKMAGSVKRDKYYESFEDFYFRPITDSYFKFLGTNVITMSTDIVNRKKWLRAAKGLKRFIGHNFIHCFVIGTMIKNDQKIYHTATPEVQYLSNNQRIWPNDIWKDYNNVLLGYLLDIGYPKDKISVMRKAQSVYEKREAATKQPILKYVYRIARPFIALARQLKSKAIE